MDFLEFKKDVERAFKSMEGKLFVVDIDKDKLWETYLNAFPEEERQQHNCNTCKAFIRYFGPVVYIDEQYVVKSFWENVTNVNAVFSKVAKALAKEIIDRPIKNIFMLGENEYHGCDHNTVMASTGMITWNHLYINDLKPEYRFNHRRDGFTSADALKGDARARREVFFRSLTELTTYSLDTVIELIEDNNLYRGQEFLKSLKEFRWVKTLAEGLVGQKLENYTWKHWDNPVAKIRNTAMGTLLIDLSKGNDLESSVRSYENIMAPSNYKRPNAIISKRQIAEAQKKVEELGLTDALPRRHAKVEDISVNNVLFVDRNTKSRMKDSSDVFSMLTEEKGANVKECNSKAIEIGIDKFISEIIPQSNKLELLLENKHSPNFMTLTAPVNSNAGNLFKWNNNFAWVYNGSVADSFKEKVKAAGGSVEGFLRCSLHWFNYDDLDLHMLTPDGGHIYFGNTISAGGQLDVDMNVSPTTRDAVENIIFKNRPLCKGTYNLFVNNYTRREHIDLGFEVEIEIDGTLYKYNYDKEVRGDVQVAEIYVNDHIIEIKHKLPVGESQKSQNVWNLDTLKFHEVNCIMYSPNYWDNQEIGNKHVFFMLKDCLNPDPVRGFFNEYLRADLEKQHHRVFEAIGSKAKTEFSNEQLSGLGFSSTQRNEVIIKSNNKLYKVKF